MQQNYPMMLTVDELRRAENGDPWAVLLVGILRTVPSNNGFHADRASGPDNSEHSPETRPAGEPNR